MTTLLTFLAASPPTLPFLFPITSHPQPSPAITVTAVPFVPLMSFLFMRLSLTHQTWLESPWGLPHRPGIPSAAAVLSIPPTLGLRAPVGLEMSAELLVSYLAWLCH